MLTPTPEQQAQILQIGLQRVPREACGVYTKSSVTELTNYAEEDLQYTIDGKELVDALVSEFGDKVGFSDFVIWHTHPSGHIGPSARDMSYRREQPHLQHFVMALPNGEGAIF